jgi:hypothetical protein
MIERLVPFMLAFCTFFAATIAPVWSDSGESHIYTTNKTTDAWVWVTVYTRTAVKAGTATQYSNHNRGAWCVGPGQTDKHGLHAMIDLVRGEITKTAGCAHPVVADQWNTFGSPANRVSNFTLQKAGLPNGTARYEFNGGGGTIRM